MKIGARIRFVRGVLAAVLISAAVSLHAAAAEPAIDLAVPAGVGVSALMRPDETKSATPLAFDIDPDGLPVMADGPALKVMSSSSELLTLGVLHIDDFAWMRDEALLLVTQGHLASLSPKGVDLGLALPSPDMRIRPAGDDTAYVFGGATPPYDRDVYLFARDGSVTKLATMPQPIAAVAGDGTTSYVAAGSSIVQVTLNQPARILMEAADPILSLEAAPQGGLFYATKSAVGYVDNRGQALDFIRGDGGALRTRGSNLFVLLSSGNLLRVGPVERFGTGLNAPSVAQAPEPTPPGREQPKQEKAASLSESPRSQNEVRKPASLNGQWRVNQNCDRGKFEIELSITHTSPTEFKGSSLGITTGQRSQIVNGRLLGDDLRFTRQSNLLSDQWSAKLSGPGRFSGTSIGPGWRCSYTAVLTGRRK